MSTKYTEVVKKSPRGSTNTTPVVVKPKRGVRAEVDIKSQAQTPAEEAVKKFGPFHVEAKQAHTAILLMRSAEQHIVIESLNSLQKFCKKRPENKDMFVELGGADEAVHLICHPHQVVQRIALKLLAMSSPIHKAKLLFRDSDTVKDMIHLAQLKDEVIVEYATVIMSNTATLYTGRLQIIQYGGIPVLIDLIGHPDPDIQRNSAETIWRILEEPLNIQLLATATNIAAIIRICDSEYPAVQIIGLSILEKITKRSQGVEVVEKADIIPNLAMKISNMELGDIHRVTLKIMVNMSASPLICKKLSLILAQIVDLMDNTHDLRAQIYAVVLLGKMATILVIARGLVDYGLTAKIISILQTHADLEIREAAAITAAQLASSDYRAKVQLVSAIGSLITFFGEDGLTGHAYENIVLALSIILEESSSACPVFIEEGGIKLLLKIFSDNSKFSDETIVSAMTCVSLLTLHWELRKYIVGRGLVPAIIACLDRSHPQLLALSANAICGLLCDEEGRKEFMEKKGITNLIDIVSHAEFPVVSSAVPIIHIIGSYSKLAYELVENGLLQAIWKRQDLISRNGPFRTAYERLVTSHLPAKFAIHGHIDPFEKLESGFYDSGHLKKGEKFCTLRQVNYQERDPTKRVLYLNLNSEVDETVLELNNSLKVMIEENQTIESYIDEVCQLLGSDNVRSEKALVGIIATVIASKLGGQLDKWRLSAESEDLEIANLQNKYESVVIPVTMLTNGAQRPRALIFKALADRFGIPCTLDRGGYKKYWNVILLSSKRRMKPACPCADQSGNPQNPVFTEKLRRYVVDLIYQPGSLFPINSYEANAYCFF